jgi:hypothetical protein
MTLPRFASARLVVPTLAVTASLAAAAPAQGSSCILNYAECLVRAADLDAWWQRSAAGLDCYLDTVACIRGAYF